MAEITVVITNYNYEEYVVEAIQSVKDQTYKDWECLILDDASTDGSVEVIRETVGGDDRFVAEYHKENQGVAALRNHALDTVKTPFLIFLDADDYLHTPALEMMKAVMDSDPEIGFVYCQPDGVPWTFPEYELSYLLADNYVTITTLIRMSVVGDVRFEAEWPLLEDWVFWTTLGITGAKGKLCNAPLFFYRQSQESRNRSKSPRQALEVKDKIMITLATRYIEYTRKKRVSEVEANRYLQHEILGR